MSNSQLTEDAKNLIDIYRQHPDKDYNKTDEAKIKVHDVTSTMAFLYEKVRNTVDYQDEHLLRKNAIARILKRRLATEKSEFDAAKFLISELIRAKYLPNNTIPELRIPETEEIIGKYTLLLNKISPKTKEGKEERGSGKEEKIFDWIIGIASCEIEEKLVPRACENAFLKYAAEITNQRTILTGREINKEEKEILSFIAVLRSLTKSDLDLIRYQLFKRQHSEWFVAPSEMLIGRLAKNAYSTVSKIESQINHSLGDAYLRYVKGETAYFTILQEIIAKNKNNPKRVFGHHLYLEDAIKESCSKKYKEAAVKLKRSAVRSILYILITKMTLALILELPFDKYILGEVDYFALGINIIFPPFLMFLVASNIKIPSKKNTEKIVKGIKEMVYGKSAVSPYKIKSALKRNSFFNKLFKLFYALVFFVSFGLIIFVLDKLNFSVVSIALFLFFLSVVSFFGIRISQITRELVVIEKKEGIKSFLVDLFSLPIIQMGRWLSKELSKINIFVFVFDFIIEAPFKTFVEIFEDWIGFMKEKKEEIY